jgi:hypothetical protein
MLDPDVMSELGIYELNKKMQTNKTNLVTACEKNGKLQVAEIHPKL